jgi:hypothetical protein
LLAPSEYVCVLARNEAGVESQLKEFAGLESGPVGYAEVAAKLGSGCQAVAFGDVDLNRDSGTQELVQKRRGRWYRSR